MRIDREELAWAAGFFDGEGSTCSKLSTLGDKRSKLCLSVTQKGVECLERFNRAIGGLAKIYTRVSDIPILSIQNTQGVDTALNLLWPYLSGPKREQATRTGFVYGIVRTSKVGRPKGSKDRQPRVKERSL